MKKILALTATRSEYDLLSDLYKAIDKDPELDIKLILSGAHMSSSYGSSLDDIEKDGIEVLAKFETLLDSDTKLARLKSGTLLLISAIDLVASYKPDVILYAGDREEVIIGGLIGAYLEIPTVHFYGGDHVADSHVDNPVRHATSKLSTAHFVSCEEHKQRILSIGEPEERVYNIGSVALDKFHNREYLDIEVVKKEMGIKAPFDKFALVIFHPIPKEREHSGDIFRNILKGLKAQGLNAFVSYPNIDPGNKKVVKVIDELSNDPSFCFYKNLPRDLFMSVYKNASMIIGNSSSGVLESASLKIPAINVGYRQTGRKPNENMIYSGISEAEINAALEKAVSESFQEKMKTVKNIYGDGNSAQRALELIKTIDLKSMIFKDKDSLTR